MCFSGDLCLPRKSVRYLVNWWFSTKTPFTLQLGQSMSNAGLEGVLWNKSETQVCPAEYVSAQVCQRGGSQPFALQQNCFL